MAKFRLTAKLINIKNRGVAIKSYDTTFENYNTCVTRMENLIGEFISFIYSVSISSCSMFFSDSYMGKESTKLKENVHRTNSQTFLTDVLDCETKEVLYRIEVKLQRVSRTNYYNIAVLNPLNNHVDIYNNVAIENDTDAENDENAIVSYLNKIYGEYSTQSINFMVSSVNEPIVITNTDDELNLTIK